MNQVLLINIAHCFCFFKKKKKLDKSNSHTENLNMKIVGSKLSEQQI